MHSIRLIFLWVGLLAISGAALAQEAVGHDEAYRVLDKAKAEAGSIPEQASALARMAWTDNQDPVIAARARQELVEFGSHGLRALHQAIRKVDSVYQADVVVAVIEARNRITSGMPPEYLPSMADAIWFGSAEAKRLALPQVTHHKFQPALLSIMDAAYEYPELTADIVHALGLFDDDRARHFLNDVLHEGTPEERRLASVALARIGRRALPTLREATRSDNALARITAIRALLPISTIDDLSLLYEYVGMHTEDDAQLTADLTARAEQLEILLEQRLENESATFNE